MQAGVWPRAKVPDAGCSKHAILRAYTLRKKPMRVKLVVKWASTLVAAFITVGAAQAADKKPNVVMLMSDDVGWSRLRLLWRRRGARPSDTEH